MEEGTSGEHVAAAIRSGTFCGREAQFELGGSHKTFSLLWGGGRRFHRELSIPPSLDPTCVSVRACLQHDAAVFNFSSFLFPLAATRESQYGNKPFEQTLSVDLCGTAGNRPPSH